MASRIRLIVETLYYYYYYNIITCVPRRVSGFSVKALEWPCSVNMNGIENLIRVLRELVIIIILLSSFRLIFNRKHIITEILRNKLNQETDK